MSLSTFNFKTVRMLAALIGLFLVTESSFRYYYFGTPAIYKFWEYSPRGITLSKFIAANTNPNIGFTLSPNKEGLFKGAYLSTNDLGYRNSGLPTSKKMKDTYRIALLGASIDMGSGVSNEQTYASLLEKSLNNTFSRHIEVQNHAVGGYKAIQIEASFWSKVDKLKPDVVLLSLHPKFFNRVYRAPNIDNTNEFCFEIRCHLQHFFILNALTAYSRDLTKHLSKIGWFGDKKRWRAIVEKERHQNKLNKTKDGIIYKRFINDLQTAGYKVVVIRLPSLDSYLKQQKGEGVNNIWKQWLREVSPVFTIDTYYKLQSKISLKDKIYLGDNHPNYNAHSLYADAIFPELSSFIASHISNEKIAMINNSNHNAKALE